MALYKYVYYYYYIITEIDRRMFVSTADPRETAFLYHRISVAIQRYNAVCLANTFISDPS